MHKHNNVRLKWVLICLVVVILMLGVGILIVNYRNILTGGDVDDEASLAADRDEAEKEEMMTNGRENYIVWMTEKIENATSDEEKAELYHARAWQLYNDQQNGNGDYTELILADAHAAEELVFTIDTALKVSFYESELGDKAIAERYMDIAKERGYVEH